MKVTHPARSSELGFNMTPMIDVVFLLIIFFLVSSHLARQESQLPLPLPVAESGDLPPESALRRMTINLREDGQLSLGGRAVATEELADRLAAAVAERGTEFEVRIRGDRQVAYQHVEPVLWACAQAGLWNVAFAVYRPEESR